MVDGKITLKAGETLDYESTASYDLNVRVRDDKDDHDGVDTSWDDEISIPIDVTNIDEAGTVTLGSNNPEVNVALSASLNDPDGSVADLTWQWQKADTVDATTWTDISDATASSYTPVTGDAGKFIRAEASYDDGEGTGKEAVRAADNAVLADTPTNQSPSFTEGATATRSVREDATAGDFVGTPIVATDPDPDDTLDYRGLGRRSSFFTTPFTSGQIFLRAGAYLDYERARSYTMTVQVRDKKDADGEDDIVWDAFIDVTINVIDVDEPGTVELTTETPQVSQEISAELDDPDYLVSNLSWQWQTADTADATTWTDVTDATTGDYTPTSADHGKFLRAQATYDDKHGTGKIVHGTSANAVPPRAANQGPTFEGGTTATRSVSEAAVTGTRLGAAVLASDAENDKLTYSLVAGDDAANFIVDSATGELEVAAGALLDFETKPSLTVVVQVTDDKDSGHNSDSSIDDTITVTVDLINADEAGKVSLSTSRPRYGEAVTASLTDADGGETSITWQWAKSHDDGATWTDLANATSDTYTPVAADEGALLRATASYTDAQGPGKSAAKTSGNQVQAPQQRVGNPAQATLSFYEECRSDASRGLVARCGKNQFAVFRVELDGRYTIDWSEWDRKHPDATGYTIILSEMVYRAYFQHGSQLTHRETENVYERCEFIDGKWDCRGPLISNYNEDMNGRSTQSRVVATATDQTQWSASLDAPGLWVSENTFHRWSGDPADPANEPTPVAYVTKSFEMDLYRFVAQGIPRAHGTLLVDGANGFEARE